MTHLGISLLGSFTVTLDGQPATDFDSNKVRALLAYLAVESDRPHRRETLAGMLWPEATDRSAFNNLRYSLSDLRQTIGDRQAAPPFLLISHDSLQFNRYSDHSLDVVSLQRGLIGEPDDPAGLLGLTEAVQLYRGWFLEGFSVSGSAPFEEWAVFKREQIGRQALSALNRLADYYERHGDFNQACFYATRQIELEPWQEEAHRQLMRALVLSGSRSAALHQYEVCRRTLLQELNVEPATETTGLYHAIRSEAVHDRGAARRNPFKGLEAFCEADAADFFGREADTGRLVAAVRTQSTVLLSGASGCGKSSLVQAGLLPRLKQEGGWAMVDVFTGSSPMLCLASALGPLLRGGENGILPRLDTLAEDLAAGRTRLAEVAELIFARNPGFSRLLLIFDQLEDLLERAADDEELQSFVGWLAGVVAAGSTGVRNPRPPIVLLLVVREDRLSQIAGEPAFAAATRSGLVLLGPMSRADLEEVCHRPAERLGVGLETGLPQRLVGDAAGQPGGLALLQLTLMELWQCRHGGALTHAAYGAIGRMSGVAARHAMRETGLLPLADQDRARMLLVQLVRPGDATADVCRPARLADLAAAAATMLSPLVRSRLVVTSRASDGQTLVELAHDGLVGQWEQMKYWVDADRDFFSWLEETRVAQRQWQAAGESDDLLLRGPALDQARDWLRARGAAVSATVRQYVARSLSAQSLRLQQEESRRQSEAARAAALAASDMARRAERRRNARLAFAAAAMAAWSLIATGAFVVHWLTSP